MGNKIVIDEWAGCYPSKWKGLIVPEAIAHPAKFSSKLIRRIYDHMRREGWIKPGDTVVDPFGGVALGAFDAMRLGLRSKFKTGEAFFEWWRGYRDPDYIRGSCQPAQLWTNIPGTTDEEEVL